MRFLLLTTTDLAAKREASLRRLLASIAAQRNVDVAMRVLVQNCDAAALAELKSWLPPFVQADAVASRLSLSCARNRLLRGLQNTDAAADTVIAFPDDDCWYPDGFLSRLGEFFATHPSAALFVCGFGAAPGRWTSGTDVRRACAARIVRTTSSNTLFLRGTALTALQTFDESLGLGARFSGGEDTDFAIRAFLNSREAYVAPAQLVGHPDTSLQTVGKYYRGTALAIAKHARRRPALFIQFVRKMIIGAVLLCRGDIVIGDLTPSVRRVWRSRP